MQTRGVRLAARRMRLIQAEQRNARVERWWEAYSAGTPTSKRVARMREVNRACIRIGDLLGAAWLAGGGL
jgi:hypothetical protein